MKLLIDATTTQDQFATRGIGRFTKEIVTRLVEERARAGGNKDDQFYLLLFNAPTTLNGLMKEYPDTVRTVNIGKRRISGKFDFIWWRLQYMRGIRKAIQKYDPDLYYCPYFLRGFPGGKIPTVVMIYDFAFPVIGRYSMAPKYLDWIRKLQYHSALRKVRHAAGVVTISRNTKKDLLKYVPRMDENKVKTIYLGLNKSFKPKKPRASILKKYLPKATLDRGYIMYYGGLEINKNVPNLVRSYAELKKLWSKSGPDSQSTSPKQPLPALVLAGGDFTKLDMRYPVLCEIRDMIRDLDLSDDVCFTGYYDDEHACDLLSAASLFVHLSLYEGFGFSPLEAMKCGVPVVASDRSCYPEVLKDGALLVDPERPKKVAKACYKLLTDRKLENKQVARGKAVADGYTWDKTTHELWSYMKEVAQQAGVRTE